jgi:UDP:flavonoid glycosyltransferase YjiC (YdhE family)
MAAMGLMRVLKNGLPMVVIPELGGDRSINVATAEAWGAGRRPFPQLRWRN